MNLIDLKERIAISNEWSHEERNFLLNAVNLAAMMSEAHARGHGQGHGQLPAPAGEIIPYAMAGGIVCSVCAPNSCAQRPVEAAVELLYGGRWRAIQHPQHKTPDPCGRSPARQHWFLARA